MVVLCIRRVVSYKLSFERECFYNLFQRKSCCRVTNIVVHFMGRSLFLSLQCSDCPKNISQCCFKVTYSPSEASVLLVSSVGWDKQPSVTEMLGDDTV